MITTIAGLIAVNFGIMFAFNISDMAIRLIPNLLLAMSIVFLVISYFPKKRIMFMDVPNDIMETYRQNANRKYFHQKLGFGLFIVALIAIAITSLSLFADPNSSGISKITLNGNITLLPPT